MKMTNVINIHQMGSQPLTAGSGINLKSLLLSFVRNKKNQYYHRL